MSAVSEFQTAGAEQQKARLAKLVLVVGLPSVTLFLPWWAADERQAELWKKFTRWFICQQTYTLWVKKKTRHYNIVHNFAITYTIFSGSALCMLYLNRYADTGLVQSTIWWLYNLCKSVCILWDWFLGKASGFDTVHCNLWPLIMYYWYLKKRCLNVIKVGPSGIFRGLCTCPS